MRVGKSDRDRHNLTWLETIFDISKERREACSEKHNANVQRLEHVDLELWMQESKNLKVQDES